MIAIPMRKILFLLLLLIPVCAFGGEKQSLRLIYGSNISGEILPCG
jgi:hypothetical protein